MRKIFFLALFTVLAFTLWGQVDRTELESVDYSGVEFRNYEGPHLKIDTIAEIRGIGVILARWDEAGRGRYFNKYQLLHLVDPEEVGRLDADILILDPAAGVDHIDNLRRILSAYLETAYDYPRDNADLLARFITYYNAVYRQRGEYFAENYTTLVNNSLNQEKVGLSTRYEEWPGKTEIVIPLTGREGGPALETDTLTDKDVVESLREREDRGIEERKEITELKEEEIQTEERAIEEEHRALEEREEALEEAKEEIRREEEELAQGDISPQEEEEARQDLEEDKVAIAQEERALEEEKQTLEDREEKQTERLEQIREEREQIAEDERELQAGTAAAEAPPEEPAGIPFLMFRLEGDRLGRLILADAATGDALTRSTLENIRSPGFTLFSGGYLVIAGEDAGNRIISLVMLDQEDLSVMRTATEKVSKESGLFLHQGSVYAVVERDGRWIPGRFDGTLALTGVLDEEVAEFSFFGFNGGHILYQDSRGRVGSSLLSDFTVPDTGQ